MPDYSACINSSCKKRYTCARYCMIYSRYQACSCFNPDETGECEDWWPIKDAPFRCYSKKEMKLVENLQYITGEIERKLNE